MHLTKAKWDPMSPSAVEPWPLCAKESCAPGLASTPYDCQREETVVAEHGTVMVWFGSASQVTSPELSTTMYLYSTTVPGAKLTVTSQSGLLEV